MSDKIKFKILKHAGNLDEFNQGDVIFKKGDPGETMFVVASGTVDIVAEGSVVDQLTEGDIFGEMSLIDKQVRSADAVANTDCSLVTIDEKRFLYMTDHTPRFALQVMRLVARRLRERMAELEELRKQ
ncbi:MAG: Crp/Fnr family transcriptional regulator [Puniceicoccaceae bacterium]